MKLKFIDSIRGIAILMVVLVHTHEKIPGVDSITTIIANYGQMGVQLFFIASAYTLCLSSLNRENESLPLVKYSIRRYFRIAPAYYLGILIYFGISLLLAKFKQGEFILADKYNLPNIASNMFFVHDFYPPGNNNIVFGGWSIGTEMTFYLLFPMLFSIARDKCQGSIKNIIAFIFIGIVISQIGIVLLSFIGFSISNNSFVFYNIINQLPVFLLGIGYFFVKKNFNIEMNWIYSLLFFGVFTMISLSLWYSGVDYFFSIIPIISGISFLFLFELFEKFDFLNHNLLIRIGQVSFSMYLLHFIFAYGVKEILVSKIIIVNGTITLLIFYVFSVFLSFGLALISEKYIEKPGVALGRKLIKKLDVRVTAKS